MKIHRRIVATEIESTWQPCRECRFPFAVGEVLTAIDTESADGVLYWFCERCTESYFGHLLRRGWRSTWQIRQAGRRRPVDWNKAG